MEAFIINKKQDFILLFIPELNNLAVNISTGRIMAWEKVDLSKIDTKSKDSVEFPDELGAVAISLARAQKEVNDRRIDFLRFL